MQPLATSCLVVVSILYSVTCWNLLTLLLLRLCYDRFPIWLSPNYLGYAAAGAVDQMTLESRAFLIVSLSLQKLQLN